VLYSTGRVDIVVDIGTNYCCDILPFSGFKMREVFMPKYNRYSKNFSDWEIKVNAFVPGAIPWFAFFDLIISPKIHAQLGNPMEEPN